MTAIVRRTATLAAALATVACAARGPVSPLAPAQGIAAASYRGVAAEEDGSRHRFRASLFAADPDRLHLEIAGPVGGTQWIVDAGGGRLAVTWVPEGVSYTGDEGPGALDRVLGVRAGVGDIVGAILHGRPIEGVDTFQRTPAAGEGYPEVVEVRRGARMVRLERLSVFVVPEGSRAALGTGEAPAGVRREPLDELPASVTPFAPAQEGT